MIRMMCVLTACSGCSSDLSVRVHVEDLAAPGFVVRKLDLDVNGRSERVKASPAAWLDSPRAKFGS